MIWLLNSGNLPRESATFCNFRNSFAERSLGRASPPQTDAPPLKVPRRPSGRWTPAECCHVLVAVDVDVGFDVDAGGI